MLRPRLYHLQKVICLFHSVRAHSEVIGPPEKAGSLGLVPVR